MMGGDTSSSSEEDYYSDEDFEPVIATDPANRAQNHEPFTSAGANNDGNEFSDDDDKAAGDDTDEDFQLSIATGAAAPSAPDAPASPQPVDAPAVADNAQSGPSASQDSVVQRGAVSLVTDRSDGAGQATEGKASSDGGAAPDTCSDHDDRKAADRAEDVGTSAFKSVERADVADDAKSSDEAGGKQGTDDADAESNNGDGEEKQPMDAWRDDPGIVISDSDDAEAEQRRHEADVLASTTAGWGAQLAAHPHPNLLGEFTVKPHVRHILNTAVRAPSSPPKRPHTTAHRRRRGNASHGTRKRRGGKGKRARPANKHSRSVPALRLDSTNSAGQAAPLKFSPVVVDEQGTDVAQSSARGQHFYDMAAMKAVINREGQLREVKHNVKLVRDALAADPSTNVDTLMKELMDSLLKLRTCTVATVESITDWRKFMASQSPKHAAPEDDAATDARLPAFVWEGRDYLRVMRSDVDFLADCPQLLEILNLPPDRLRNNPLMSPLTLSELADKKAEAMAEEELQQLHDEANGRPAATQPRDAAPTQESNNNTPQDAQARRLAAQDVLVQEELAAREDAAAAATNGAVPWATKPTVRLEDSVRHPLFTSGSKQGGRRRKRGNRKAHGSTGKLRLESSLSKSINEILLRQNRRTSLQSPPARPAPGVLAMPDGRLVHDPDSDITQQRGGAKLVPLPLGIVSHTYTTHGFHPTRSVSSLDSLAQSSTWSLPMVTPSALRPASPEERRALRRAKSRKSRRGRRGRSRSRSRPRPSTGELSDRGDGFGDDEFGGEPRGMRVLQRHPTGKRLVTEEPSDLSVPAAGPHADDEGKAGPVDDEGKASQDEPRRGSHQRRRARQAEPVSPAGPSSPNGEDGSTPGQQGKKKKARRKRRKKKAATIPAGRNRVLEEQEQLKQYMAMQAEKQKLADAQAAKAEAARRAEAREAALDAVEYEDPTDEDYDKLFTAAFGCTAKNLTDFGALRSVESGVGLVAAVVMVCLSHSNHVPHDLSWAGVRYTYLRVEALAKELGQFDPDHVAVFKIRACMPLLAKSVRRITASAFSEAGPGACALLRWLVRLIHHHPEREAVATPELLAALEEVAVRLPGECTVEQLKQPLQPHALERRKKPSKRELQRREQARKERAAVKIQAQARRKVAIKRVDEQRIRRREELLERRRAQAATRIQSHARRRAAATRVHAVREKHNAAVRVQSIARSRLARNKVRARAQFHRSPSGRALRVRRRVSLVQVTHLFNDGVRRVVDTCRIGRKTAYEITAKDADGGGEQGELKLALPWELFSVPSRKRNAEEKALRQTVERLMVMLETSDGRLQFLTQGEGDVPEPPPPGTRKVLVVHMNPDMGTTRRVGDDMLKIRVARLYGGKYGASGFGVTATGLRSGECLRTYIPEEEAGVPVLSVVSKSTFQDSMMKLCNSLVVAEADGTVVLQQGQEEVLESQQDDAVEHALDLAKQRADELAAGALPDDANERAAIKIQSVQRRKAAKARMKRIRAGEEDPFADHKAATRIQAVQRRKAAKARVKRIRAGEEDPFADHKAATRIQAVQRRKAAKARVQRIRAGEEDAFAGVDYSDLEREREAPVQQLTRHVSFAPGLSQTDDDEGATGPPLPSTPLPRSASGRQLFSMLSRDNEVKVQLRSPESPGPKVSVRPSPERKPRRILDMSSTCPPAEPERLSEQGRAMAAKKREQYAAALKIQCAGRRRLAVRRVDRIRAERQPKEVGAATAIQSAQRRRSAAKRVERIRAGEEDPFRSPSPGATVRSRKFQDSQRMEAERLGVGSDGADPYARSSNAGRSHAADRRCQYDSERRQMAATKIQSMARQRSAKLRVQRIRRKRRGVNRRHRAGALNLNASYGHEGGPMTPTSSVRSSFAGSIHSMGSSTRRFRGDHPDSIDLSDDESDVMSRVYGTPRT